MQSGANLQSVGFLRITVLKKRQSKDLMENWRSTERCKVKNKRIK